LSLFSNDASKTNDIVSFKTFWENAVQIAAFTTTLASQHGYGMGTTSDDALAHSLTNEVSTFGTAYATTQDSLRSNATNIVAIQGQLQMLCQAVGTSQPPQQQPQCPRNGCSCGQQYSGNNGGGNGGGNSGGGGYNNGSSGGGYNNCSGSYSGGGGSGNANGGGHRGGGGGKGDNYGDSYGGGNGGNQTQNGLPPSPVKQYEN
jgi:hypothetical protein